MQDETQNDLDVIDMTIPSAAREMETEPQLVMGKFVKESPEAYHARRDFMSASQIKLLCKSARHWRVCHDEQIEEEEESVTLRRGRLIHNFMLEPDTFWERFAVEPAKEDHPDALVTVQDLRDRCKSLGLKASGRKEELIMRILGEAPKTPIWDVIVKQACEGKEMVKQQEQDMLLGIWESLKEYPQARALFKGAASEVSGYWMDREYGIPCKMRADMIATLGGDTYIVEMKSIQDIDYRSCKRAIWNYRYDVGAAWYMRGYEQITGKTAAGVIFFFIERKKPYSIALYNCNSDIFTFGYMGDEDFNMIGYHQAVESYKRAMKSGRFPGPQTAVQRISMIDYRD